MQMKLAAILARHNIHYAWVVVAVTFITMLTTAGSIGAPGVFITPLQKEFGWETSEISSALAFRFLLFGLMAPFSAVLINRFGVRRVALSALGIICAGLALSTHMTQLWQLFVCWGLVVGFGTGLTALVLSATISTNWFSQRRGLVMGLLTASTATGQLVILPVVALITDAAGWRVAVLFICGLLAFAALLCLLFLRTHPSELGLPAYGDAAPTAPPLRNGNVKTPFLALRDASRSPMFWLLFGTFFICGCSTNGLIQTHFIAFCGDNGMPAIQAASVLAMMGIFDFFGTVGSGWLSDRYDNRWLLFWYYGLRGVSLLFLPHADFSLYGLSLFSMFYGLDWIATVPPTLKLTTAAFGREKASIVFGWIFTGHQIGAAVAAAGGGYARTEYLTYLPAFYGAGGLCLLAAIMAVQIRPKTAGA